MDYEALAEVGAIMGSGGMIVLDEDNCMVDIARYFLAFTQRHPAESAPSAASAARPCSTRWTGSAPARREGDLERLE